MEKTRPIHLTGWDTVFVKDGVVYAAFYSGPDRVLISMGPSKLLEGIELARRALAGGEIVPLRKTRKVTPAPAH